MKRKLRNAGLALLTLAVLVAGGWYLAWLARYPRSPDPRTADLNQAIDFMADPDFNRLTEAHRKKYILAVIDRHRDMTFQELVARALDRSDAERRKKIARNVRNLPGGEDLGARLLEIFIDKFYQLGDDERTQYLTMIAMAENSRMAERAKERGLPDPTRLQKEMTRFMSNNSPQTQAKVGQFLMDLKRVRRMWGLKDPV